MTNDHHKRRLLFSIVVFCVGACVPDAELSDERSDMSAPLPGPQDGGSAQIAGTPTPGQTADDGLPPQVQQLVVEVGSCVHVAVLANKSAKGRFTFTLGAHMQTAAGVPRSDGWLEAFAPLGSAEPNTQGFVAAEVEDAQGRTGTGAPQPFTAPPRRAPLVITEVMANPAGSEYTQEYVEVLNNADEPLSLMGFTLEDSAGADPLPAAVLAPHAYALLVAEAFDEGAAGDVAPGAGALLVRVTGRLGRDGLTNGGEAVTLRDANGAVVSQYPGTIDMSATAWNGRSAHRVPPADPCDRPLLWTDRPQPPSPGW